MTSIPLTGTVLDPADMPFRPARPHLAVQILGLLLFSGFAIVTTAIAFVMFWLAGLVLAVFFGWIGFRRMLHPTPSRYRMDEPRSPTMPVARTGNASFDTYRAEVLDRLQDEQTSFVSFLDRLRDAKDKAEFDRFMEDHALGNRNLKTDLADVTPDEVPASRT